MEPVSHGHRVSVRFHMKRDMVGARFHECLEISPWVRNHEVDIQWEFGFPMQGLDNDRPHGEIRDKVPVHHIHMDQISARVFHRADVIS